MKFAKRLAGMAFLIAIALGMAAIPEAGSSAAQMAGMQGNEAVGRHHYQAVPAYHSQLPGGPLPATLSPAQFTQPEVQNAYSIAAGIRKALYQEPCYCHCDRSLGHGSLLDCYVSTHASVCDICMREAFYTAEQLKKGKKPAQVRDGIVLGAWQQVDLSKYKVYQPVPAKK